MANTRPHLRWSTHLDTTNHGSVSAQAIEGVPRTVRGPESRLPTGIGVLASGSGGTPPAREARGQPDRQRAPLEGEHAKIAATHLL